MTATTKHPTRGDVRRQLRFSAMETLGFTNPSATWTDRPIQPIAAPVQRRGKHEAPEPEPITVADWRPEDVGAGLSGRNVRWSLIVVSLFLVASATAVAYWLYQRPVAEAAASIASVSTEAENLQFALPVLETFAESLVAGDELNSTKLLAVDEAARALFDASASLQGTSSELGASASSASASALDAVRLAGDANAYRLAVTTILAAPDLETDPNLIELDEAARGFGLWQLRFDEVRTALPDETMAGTTQQLDILSGDLSGILTSYMNALREDDGSQAAAVIDELSSRLDAIGDEVASALADVQTRVGERVEESRRHLSQILGG